LIDPDLQERGWALLLDLAKDLNKFKEQWAGIEARDSRPVINPPDPPVISYSKAASQEIHSVVQAHKEGTVNGATILRSRILEGLKGKQIQEGGNIHGSQQPFSFSETPASSSATPGKTASASLLGASSSR
jgi:hypothetical protein